MTLGFKYIFVTTPYTMPFIKAASENTLLLPIIEALFYRNVISSVLLERERLFFYQGL